METARLLDSENTLIIRTQNGDTEAFNPLVSKYQHRLYTHITRRIRDPDTAKDLCQETWLKAFRAINTFRADSAFYSWIYRIAENICIDFLRKQKALDNTAPLHTVKKTQIAQTYADPFQHLVRKELQRKLKTAIAALPTMRKKVLLLRYAKELSIKEIATRINRSEGTVKTHLYKAHHQLRELLTTYLKDQNIP